MLERLIAWYRQQARPLPWRETHDPYRLWLSEILLQQTQVVTVLRYYPRFLDQFPTVEDLAHAPIAAVLEQWQGLGYYRRAHNLHRTAQQIAAAGGRWPASAAQWRHLPGIGDYTAAALASLVNDEAVAAIDGNVERVLARVLALPGDPRRGADRAALRAYAAQLVPKAQPGEFNQALIELGATVCQPRPNCAACCWADDCRAHALGDPATYPRRRAVAAPRQRRHAVALIERDGRWLLGRRPAGGRWGGLWEFPRIELEPDADPSPALRAQLPALLGVAAEVGRERGRLRHAVSGEAIELVGLEVTIRGEPDSCVYDELAWLTPETVAMPIWQKRLWERR